MRQRPASRLHRPTPVEPLEPRRLLCDPATLAVMAQPGTDMLATAAADDPAGSGPSVPGPGLPERPALSWTTGLKRVLYVRATFSDRPRHQPQSVTSVRRSMAFADAFVRANSYGKTSFRVTITDTVVLPHPASFYGNHRWDQLRADALAAVKARRLTWDPDNHDLDVIRYDGGPAPDAATTGFAMVNKRGGWLRDDSPALATHELGHNLGLRHANGWRPADPDVPAGAGAHAEYGNPADVMGTGAEAAAHFSAYAKHFLGWVPDAAVAEVDESGTYAVAPADATQVPGAGRFSALTVRKDGFRDYWLSARGAAAWSGANGPRGLEVMWGAWSRTDTLNSNLGSHLLDMTPQAAADAFDYGLPVGRTFSDASAGVHVTPLRRGADGVLDVRVEFDADQDRPNAHAPRAPQISVSGGAEEPGGVLPLRTVRVAVGQPLSLWAASGDADGDDLAYAWDFGAGAVGGTHGPGGVVPAAAPGSPAVTPAATARYDVPGVHRVRVTVSDLRGRAASASLLVRVTGAVAPTHPNVVTGRVVDPFGAPVGQVRVGEGRHWAYTDDDGVYALVGLDSAPRTLLASAPGGWTFAPVGFANPLGPGLVTLGADFRATPVGHRITGTVATRAGTALAGVLVSDGTHSALTDTLGRFSIPAGNGVHTLTFDKPGYPVNNATVVVDNADVEVRAVAEVASAFGQLLGAPAGVRLSAVVRLGGRTAEVSMGGGQGSFFFPDQPRGTLSAAVVAVGPDLREYNFVPDGWANPLVVDGSSQQINFRYDPERKFAVRGRVFDGVSGVGGVTVTVANAGAPDDGEVVATAVTDDAGYYNFTALLPRTYAVTARKPGVALNPADYHFELNANRNGVDFSAPPPPPDRPPQLVRPAAAEPPVAAGTSTYLTAGADDDRGAGRLVYTWRVVSAPQGAAVSFSHNAGNTAARTLATFDRAGEYRFECVVTDGAGGRVTTATAVTVASVASVLRVGPGTAVLAPGTSRQFSATVLDQFGRPAAGVPPVTWRAVAPDGRAEQFGTIAADGTFTVAPTVGADRLVRGAVVASADVPGGRLEGSAAVDARVPNAVVRRLVFYNNSAFDGGNPAALPNDDAAVALDKRPLLPGGRATAANYTGYDKGINGVMIDLDGVWSREWTAADFEFSVGGGPGTTGWAPAPAPREVAVRWTVWKGGIVERVTVTWNDRAIRNRWLRVTVLPTERTGLAAPDVFYFGNLAGDTGDAPPGASVAHVATLDYANTVRRAGTVATITSAFDHDRDGLVTDADVAITRRHRGGWIQLITADA